MIYLFEDREGRKKEFLTDDGQYPMIRHKPFDCASTQRINDYICNNYQDAKVVLLHKSYSFKEGSNITPELVKDSFKQLMNVPVVLFSGGSDSNLIKEGEMITAEINSGVMYGNLRVFHDSFLKTGSPNLSILLYGIDYKRNQLLGMQQKLFIYLFERKEEETLSQRDISKIRQIIESISDPDIIDDISTLKDWMFKVSPLNINKFMDQVQKMINLY